MVKPFIRQHILLSGRRHNCHVPAASDPSQRIDRIKEKGYPVTAMETYSNMENYEKVDNFLKECLKGKSGSVVVYELHSDGGIGRDKFIFDGENM